ncbi:hypothetical protein Fcan01_16605 [Folsomia candida]|uniref:Uncharacterized protein n=1 Tax=Folsomia candida TaxID=158441 RepID=A0A226DUX4_FOLCA|nr:hypothetical protein Fcan01_16605 [Folsomia candida]
MNIDRHGRSTIGRFCDQMVDGRKIDQLVDGRWSRKIGHGRWSMVAKNWSWSMVDGRWSQEIGHDPWSMVAKNWSWSMVDGRVKMVDGRKINQLVDGRWRWSQEICHGRWSMVSRKFEIQYDAEFQNGDYLQENLYTLLRTHSLTLESLTVQFPTAFDKVMEWKFPIFKAMKRFHIESGMNNRVEFEMGCCVSRKFGRIDYTKCFPVLESLHVISTSWQSFSSVEEMGFLVPKGKEGSVGVGSAKKVEMNIPYDVERKDHMEARTTLLDRLVKTFPNARDSDFGRKELYFCDLDGGKACEETLF